jgi:hypothetical protein
MKHTWTWPDLRVTPGTRRRWGRRRRRAPCTSPSWAGAPCVGRVCPWWATLGPKGGTSFAECACTPRQNQTHAGKFPTLHNSSLPNQDPPFPSPTWKADGRVLERMHQPCALLAICKERCITEDCLVSWPTSTTREGDQRILHTASTLHPTQLPTLAVDQCIYSKDDEGWALRQEASLEPSFGDEGAAACRHRCGRSGWGPKPGHPHPRRPPPSHAV